MCFDFSIYITEELYDYFCLFQFFILFKLIPLLLPLFHLIPMLLFYNYYSVHYSQKSFNRFFLNYFYYFYISTSKIIIFQPLSLTTESIEGTERTDLTAQTRLNIFTSRSLTFYSYYENKKSPRALTKKKAFRL